MPKDASLNFSLSEYADRLARTRAAMAAKDIDCLLVVDPSNMSWLSGYDGWSFYTHQCPVSYTHLTLPTTGHECRSRGWAGG